MKYKALLGSKSYTPDTVFLLPTVGYQRIMNKVWNIMEILQLCDNRDDLTFPFGELSICVEASHQ